MVAGTWILAEVDGASPSSVHIGEYRATFSNDGTWSYEASMLDQFEGMQLKGHGKWSIEGGSLSWTAGANAGVSTISSDGRSLVFEPDPVVALDGGSRKTRTKYRRVAPAALPSATQ